MANKVRMEDSNGNFAYVPVNEVAERIRMASKAGGWARVVKRPPGMLQRGVDALPDVGGAVGGFMGITPGQRAANAARLGVAGRATSHVINSISGVEPSWSTEDAYKNLGAEGAKQYAMGMTGDGIAKVGSKLAPVVMKSSLGRAAVGSAQKALKYGLAPTERFLSRMTERIGLAKGEAVRLARAIESRGVSFDYERLVAPLKGAIKRARKFDVTGTQAESALSDVYGTMRSKLGPQTTHVPADPSISGEVWNQPMTHTVPAEPITPTELQEMIQITGDKLHELFKAKQGKIGVAADPKEAGYMKVWVTLKRALESSGGEGRRIGALNKQMQEMYKMHTLASKAGERAVPITSPMETGAAVLAGTASGIASHNPALGAAIGIPSMFMRHALTSPEALAAEARMLNSGGFRAGARLAPRAVVAAYNQATLPGVPEMEPNK